MATDEPPRNFVTLLTGRDFSRLLYANPVCFLTTQRPSSGDGGQGSHNVMVISWLSPVNNEGTVMLSMNKRRFSAVCLESRPEFVLSVPVAGMEPLVLQVGKYSGRRGDKFTQIPSLVKIPIDDEPVAEETCESGSSSSSGGGGGSGRTRVGNRFAALLADSSTEGSGSDSEGRGPAEVAEGGAVAPLAVAPLVTIGGTAAWLKCIVLRKTDVDDDHHLIVAQVVSAAVDERYWNGKCFAPRDAGTPQALAFLGSQVFARTAPTPTSTPPAATTAASSSADYSATHVDVTGATCGDGGRSVEKKQRRCLCASGRWLG